MSDGPPRRGGPPGPGRERNDPRRAPGLRAWLELLRLPNLLTVPGDPLAGALLAGAAAGDAARVALAGAAALALYAAGLVLNDIADLDADRRERPARPLPSGRVGVAAARRAARAAALAGVAAAFLASPTAGAVALVLLGAVVLYDVRAKRGAGGPWLLGACRALSLLMGAAAVAGPSLRWAGAVAAALVLLLYVAVFSRLARDEVAAGGRGAWAGGPALALAAGGGLLACALPDALAPWPIALGAAAVVAALEGARAWGAGRRPPAVGEWVRALLFLQAALVAASARSPARLAAALLVAALWTLHRRLSPRFAPS